MKRTKDLSSPFVFTISIINGKWKLEILEKLFDGPKRFTELERTISGITPRMLIRELKELEEKNIIQRRVYNQLPPKVEYSIREQAQSLQEIIEHIKSWGKKYLEATVASNELIQK